MFNPKYTITNKLLANIKNIATLVYSINRQNLSKIVLFEFENNAKVLSSYSSTSIEGNPLPLTEVKKIIKFNPKHLRDSEKEVLNYNNALLNLDQLLKLKKTDINLKLILKIQKTVVSDLIAKNNCGKLRIEPVFVNDPRLKKTIFVPPEDKDVKKLMNDLILFIDKNKTSIDPLILAGIFHKQFVIIHPFLDGNGRTARLITKLLLANMGLNTFNLFSFENYYNSNITKYFNKVGAFGDYYEIKDTIDYTEWLEYFSDGIIDELMRVTKKISVQVATPETELKKHDVIILDYIKEHGYITDKHYSDLTERAKATRSLDFKKLLEKKIIERHGKGKSTYYKLKNGDVWKN